MKNPLHSFAQGISKLDLTEVGYAIALLWYFDMQEGKPELRPAFLAELMNDLSLRRQVNATRLGRQLLTNRSVMRGKEMGTVRLRFSSKSRLSSSYNEIVGAAVTPDAAAHIIPAGMFDDTRPYLQTLVVQINGTYQSGFYDACAVMCRRLLNCLLVLAFESASKGNVIRDASGEYRAFARIIELASSSQHIRLARGAGAAMGKMDYVGDLAAHHPTFTTRQKDIDEQRLAFQRVISELTCLAGIKSQATAG